VIYAMLGEGRLRRRWSGSPLDVRAGSTCNEGLCTASRRSKAVGDGAITQTELDTRLATVTAMAIGLDDRARLLERRGRISYRLHSETRAAG
jgi:hypothetical protein